MIKPEWGTICINCRREPIAIIYSQLCSTCHRYWTGHGKTKMRPEHLYDRESVINFCSNCSVELRGKKPRCRACYIYWLNHGKKKERPYWLYTAPENRPCRNPYCNIKSMKNEPPNRGYCNACSLYLSRTKKMRLKDKFDMKPCKICGSECNRALVKGRCKACYFWLRDKGEERPQEIYQPYLDDPCYCRNPNCGNPIPHHEVRKRDNLCGPCFTYRHKNKGAKRPKDLCKMDFPKNLKYCSCGSGEEATHSITVKTRLVGRQRNKNIVVETNQDVCYECYEIEQEIQKGLI